MKLEKMTKNLSLGQILARLTQIWPPPNFSFESFTSNIICKMLLTIILGNLKEN